MSKSGFQHNSNHFLGVKTLCYSWEKTVELCHDNLPVPMVENEDKTSTEAKWNCDDLRRKINKLTGFKGEMSKAEFLRQTGVNSKSYYSFMKLKGCCKGITNNTFLATHRFFQKHESKEKINQFN